ncbi:MAG: type IX secretion system membrane protein PorP/SprF [Cytophagales bacterium]|nr:MAG: type IX secretion system membrane protein PorP/SprF [Cytophagales bacterium]
MKKIKIVFMLIIVSLGVYAQSDNRGLIQSTQFPVNNYMLNPAYAGAEEYTSIQGSFRRNYLGLENAPQTMYLSVHTRLQKNKKITVDKIARVDTTYPNNFTLPVRGRSATLYRNLVQQTTDSLIKRDEEDKKDYKKRLAEAKNKMLTRPYHGLGGHLINESFGGLSRFGLELTYAYHFFLSANTRLSFGATLNLASNSSAGIEYRDAESMPLASKLTPDLNVGAFLYHNKFYLGLSAVSLLMPNPYKNLAGSSKLMPIIIAHAGYKFQLNDDVFVSPSIAYRYFTEGVLPMSFDANLRMNIKSFWFGFGYRNKDAISGMLGINIAQTFDISYSYDFTIGPNSKYTRGGGSEIILGYRLKRKQGSTKSLLFN